METAINVIILLSAFISMELIAWFTHKYIMHGVLWVLHKDHHKKESTGFFEHNDFFFLVFAIPGFLLLFFGMQAGYNYLFWIGAGISLYGLMYFLIHDIFIHQRIRILRRTDNPYFKAIRRAHKIHHKYLTKEDGECFGLLWVSLKYYREQRKLK